TSVAKQATLEARLQPADASLEDLVWTSDAPSVASVDDSGVVKAVAAGKTKITAATRDGSVSASCQVYVFALVFADDLANGPMEGWDLRPEGGGQFAPRDGVLEYAAGMSGGVVATLDPQRVPKGDFYVEARIKPQMNGTTGNKQLYLI